MRKTKPDSRYFRISLHVFCTGAGLLLFYKLLAGDWSLVYQFGSALRFIWNAVSTIVAGIIIAYILLPAVEGAEKLLCRVLKKDRDSGAVRAGSVALVYVLLAGFMALAAVFMIPGLVQNLLDFAGSVPDHIAALKEWYAANRDDNRLLAHPYTRSMIDRAMQRAEANLDNRITTALSRAAEAALRLVVFLLKALLAFVLSVYFMSGRRSLKQGLFKALIACIGEKKTYAVRAFLRSVDWVFGRYISAKLLQMLIIFLIAQIVLLLLKIPYSTLFAAFIALTNLVPFIGPLIGLLPPVLISLLQSPLRALWVFLAVEGIQLLDEYLVQPHLIGDKMGLPPFWVLVSVIVAGGLFGIVGIMLAVPVAAVIKILIHQAFKRIERKKETEARQEPAET